MSSDNDEMPLGPDEPPLDPIATKAKRKNTKELTGNVTDAPEPEAEQKPIPLRRFQVRIHGPKYRKFVFECKDVDESGAIGQAVAKYNIDASAVNFRTTCLGTA